MNPKENKADQSKYKVGQIIEKYALDNMGADLESRWLGETDEPQSLRNLADDFNQSVILQVLEAHGRQPRESEVETIYETLSDDDALSSGEKTEIRRSLEHDGIDVDELQEDFVTHQAIHTYLTKGRGAQKEAPSTDRIESVKGTIQRLKSRVTAVTESSLTRLRDTGTITLGEFNVIVEISVACSDCGKYMSIHELLTEGGCDCD